MTHKRDSHLSEQELDRLLAGDAAPEELRIHLDECHDCQSLLAIHARGAEELDHLSAFRLAPSSACPPLEQWWNLPQDSELFPSLLQHAAQCERCGIELRAVTEARLGDQEVPRPAPLLSNRARAELAGRMEREWARGGVRSIDAGPRHRPGASTKYAAIAAALIIAIAGAILWLRPSTDQLIAHAYEQERTVEFRWRGASHAPLRVERGDSASRPVPLRQADARVGEELAKHPDQADLLDQQARVELLTWNYQEALPRLVRAHELLPDDTQILLDLALAYFESGKNSQRKVDYAASAEALSQILKPHPDDPVALFNRALVLENLYAYHVALEDWEHFLKLEPKGAWADEAREHVEILRKKLQAWEHDVQRCQSVDARDVVQWSQRGELSHRLESIEGGWECLRELAITKWLAAREGNARDAFESVAAAFRAETGDTWFVDIMSGSASPGFQAAASSLAEALQANLKVDAERAESAASNAFSRFQEIGNRAGAAQALVERVYANRRLQHAAQCGPIIDRLESITNDTEWTWTNLQVSLEFASCAGLAGQHDPSVRAARTVIEATRKLSLRGLHLRAITYLESAERLSGNHFATWQQGIAGLQEFWSSHEFPVWGYQLYYQLAQSAAASDQNQLPFLLQKETLSEIRRAARPIIEAFTSFDYARAALIANYAAEAQAGFATAAAQFARLNQDAPSVATTRADCEVYLAELENLQGKPAAALGRLDRVANVMESGNSATMELHYRSALARSRRLLGAHDEYQAALHALISTTERHLDSHRTFPDVLRWGRQGGDGYREAAALAVSDHDAARGLNLWESYRALPFRADRLPAPDYQPEDAAQAMRNLGILQALIYVSLDDRLIIWYAREGHVSAQSIPVSRSKLTKLSDRLSLLCSQSAGAGWQSAANDVAVFLLRPVESQIDWDRPLWIELDESVSTVPFSVLPLHSGEPAAERAQLARFPGVGYLTHVLRTAPSGLEGPMLAVGISTVANGAEEGLLPLPGAEAEAENAASGFSTARILTNGDATARNIKRDLAATVVFHFAGHSRNATDRLALIGGGGTQDEITAEEIAAMNLHRCRLAVISACSTGTPGLHHDVRGFGFAEAFLRAGTSGVLATGWNLDTQTALAFTRVFYERWAAGDTEIKAAGYASRKIRETPGLSHPYYWAAFQFFGLG